MSVVPKRGFLEYETKQSFMRTDGVISMKLHFVLVAGMILLSGCGGGSNSGVQTRFGQVNFLRFTATSPFSAKAGTNVPLTLSVLNSDTHDYTYQYTGCDEANIVISRVGQIIRTLRDPTVCKIGRASL